MPEQTPCSDNNDLAKWLKISQCPASFMHQDWWEYLSIAEKLSPICKRNTEIQKAINQYIIQKLGLPVLAIPWKESSQEGKKDIFWLNTFYELPVVACLLGIFLSKEPETVCMKSSVRVDISTVSSMSVVMKMLEWHKLIIGPVHTFLQYEGVAVKKFGLSVILAICDPSLSERIKIIFPPYNCPESSEAISLDYHQCRQVLALIKRLLLFYKKARFLVELKMLAKSS